MLSRGQSAARSDLMLQDNNPPIDALDREGGILVVTLSGVELHSASILIDRKFHEGMIGFVERLDRPFSCLMPRLTSAEAGHAMDMIEVPKSELPYRVNALEKPLLSAESLRIIESSLDGVALAYLGAFEDLNQAVASACRGRDIPYAVVSEYTLQTELEIMRANTPSAARRLWREARIRLGRHRRLRLVASAQEVHANGYPTYWELAAANPRRMLFLDTRARAQDIISEADLRERLAARANRPSRLLYAGRYHPMKGALDVIKVGIELERLGMDFQLELYGKGPLREPMALLASRSNAAGRLKSMTRLRIDRIFSGSRSKQISSSAATCRATLHVRTWKLLPAAYRSWDTLTKCGHLFLRTPAPARLSLKAIIKRSPKQWLGFWAHLVSRNCRSELATLPRRTPWRSHGTGVSRTWLPSFEFLTSA